VDNNKIWKERIIDEEKIESFKVLQSLGLVEEHVDYNIDLLEGLIISTNGGHKVHEEGGELRCKF
jgi:hypothetical protein